MIDCSDGVAFDPVPSPPSQPISGHRVRLIRPPEPTNEWERLGAAAFRAITAANHISRSIERGYRREAERYRILRVQIDALPDETLRRLEAEFG